MKKAAGSVRMGPISLVALVIILSLAVMCVLALTTSQAMLLSTKRQASATTDIYACEQAGQQFLANVDETLAEVRGDSADEDANGVSNGDVDSEDGSSDVTSANAYAASGVSKASAMEALRAKGDALLDGTEITDDDSAISSAVEISSSDDTEIALSATFVTASDRRLSVTIAIDGDATYRVLSWKTTTFWNNYNMDETLWSGETD